MLDSLRSAKSNFILQVIIALIVLSFVFWIGVGGLGTDEVQVIAMVNGERITDTDYNRALRDQLENYRRLTGQSIPPEMEGTVREQVRDDLITRTLIRQEARRMGIVVSDKELALRIADIPGLRDENGKFNRELYENFISRRPTFESDLRDDILIEKAQRLVSDAAMVSDAELKGRFLSESEQIDLEFVRISKLAFERTAEVGDDAVAAALESRKEEIAGAYEKDKARKYNIPKKARARHILKKVEEDAGAEADAAARAAIDGIYEKIKADPTLESFSALAEAESEDPISAARGGDLGLFDEKTMVPEFTEAAFALQPGQFSEVFKSNFGYHIIWLEELQEPRVIPLEEAQEEIARALLKRELGAEEAESFAARLFDAWKGGEDIEPILDEQSLKVQSTDLFSRSDGRIPRLGATGDALETAFSLTPSDPFPSAPLDVPGGYALLKLKERKEADMARLQEEKDELRGRYASEKKRKVLDAWVNQLKADANLQVASLS